MSTKPQTLVKPKPAARPTVDPVAFAEAAARKGPEGHQEKTVRLNVNMSDELHRQFKAKCALEGRNMATVIDELVRNFVRPV